MAPKELISTGLYRKNHHRFLRYFVIITLGLMSHRFFEAATGATKAPSLNFLLGTVVGPENYAALATNLLTRLVRRDTFREAFSFFRVPLEAAFMMTGTASFNASWALSTEFSSMAVPISLYC